MNLKKGINSLTKIPEKALKGGLEASKDIILPASNSYKENIKQAFMLVAGISIEPAYEKFLNWLMVLFKVDSYPKLIKIMVKIGLPAVISTIVLGLKLPTGKISVPIGYGVAFMSALRIFLDFLKQGKISEKSTSASYDNELTSFNTEFYGKIIS